MFCSPNRQYVFAIDVFFLCRRTRKKMHFVRFAIFSKMILFKNHKRPPYSFVFSAFFWNISFLFRAFVRSLWKQFGNGIASTFIPIHTQRVRKEERNNFHQKQTTTTKKNRLKFCDERKIFNAILCSTGIPIYRFIRQSCFFSALSLLWRIYLKTLSVFFSSVFRW